MNNLNEFNPFRQIYYVTKVDYFHALLSFDSFFAYPRPNNLSPAKIPRLSPLGVNPCHTRVLGKKQRIQS